VKGIQDSFIKHYLVRNTIFENFYDEFYASDLIVNYSVYMHAKRMILYLFERSELALSYKSKIIQIGSLHMEILTIKFKNWK
jgi:hypothetical protein